MITSIRRHLSYANVVATLALVFAMSGGAFAANHYLINSTRQVNPRVLRTLEGDRGPRGFPGIQGVSIQGPDGTTGAKGAKGETGHEGPAGLSSLSTLPSGRTESGVYGINGAGEGTISESVAFPLPLAGPIASTKIEYLAVAAPSKECPGPGRAVAGFLCIYSVESIHVGPPSVFEPEHGLATEGAGALGFTLRWSASAAGAGDAGTYTVTAP